MTSDPIRWFWAGAAVGLWLLSVLAVVLLRARARRRAAARSQAFASEGGGDAVVVAYASQTGLAERLAWMTADALSAAGCAVRVASLGDLDPGALKAVKRLLVIASTTGEGDPPDALSRFVRQQMSGLADLEGLAYGLLALGDRTYGQFCGFGRALDDWLRRSGAQPIFDRVEVDDGDAGAIRHWQRQLSLVAGVPVAGDWTAPAYERWRLAERTHLNPGSPGGEAWLLGFEPVGHQPHWSAGDIAEIGLPVRAGDATAASREYSVASLPADGRAELIVRRVIREDGSAGLGSGWLTGELPLDAEIDLRIRPNRSFHGPGRDTPVVLIGAGTGLAGLRAHLRARAASNAGTWLMYGERTRRHDAWLNDELEEAVASGQLTRLDRTFSRDADDGRYVQALVEAHAQELGRWVDRGATLLVCGSLEGMSRDVHAALEAALGTDRVLELLETGRYRRDVY